MFFFSSEQFERIEVEDVLDGLASPLLNFSLFAQIGTKKDTIKANYPLRTLCLSLALTKQTRNKRKTCGF